MDCSNLFRIALSAMYFLLVPLAIAQECEQAWQSGFDLPGTNGHVHAMTVFDDGSGQALYAGGSFTTAGGVAANNIARWDGVKWSPLGSGISLHWDQVVVHALEVFDDGTGPMLYACGQFALAGGQTVNNIARWNGTNWAPLGEGLNESATAFAMSVFDDGSGPALYVGGIISTAGGQSIQSMARWNGSEWTPLSTDGMSGLFTSFAVFDDGKGDGPALYVGGYILFAGQSYNHSTAKWNGKIGHRLLSLAEATGLSYTP